MKNNYKVTAIGLIGMPVLLAGEVAFNWARDRPVSALRGRWALPPSMFIDIAGMRVHLRDEGPHNDRTPIVSSHGAASSLHTWDGWVKELATADRVIRFDLPGFGHASYVFRLQKYSAPLKDFVNSSGGRSFAPETCPNVRPSGRLAKPHY